MNLKNRLLYLVFAALLLTDLNGQGRTVPMVNFAGVEPYLGAKSDTVYVINFWATWCGPCRRELPDMEKIHQDYSGQESQGIACKPGFSKSAKRPSAIPFIQSYHSPVLLLNEPDANAWIDKVDPSWTGALPATLIYKGEDRLFFEKELTYQDINNSIVSLKP